MVENYQFYSIQEIARTQITEEELIYSIYKSVFPKTKGLVEEIGVGFIAPSRVISLVSRIAQAEIEADSFPNPVNVIQFKRRLEDEKFRNKLIELIGNADNSPAKLVFKHALELLCEKTENSIPFILIKKIVNDIPDLFLTLLFWIRSNDINTISSVEGTKILSVFTALSFFGKDNSRFVREVWNNINEKDFWRKQYLKRPYKKSNDFIMYPLRPTTLRQFLIEQVVVRKLRWDSLYPQAESEIVTDYKALLNGNINDQEKESNAIYSIWNFINTMRGCKSLVLFAQRSYINKKFPDPNQTETIEDKNTLWDWDHIYPSEWVYHMIDIDEKIRDWNNSIGNLRAISLEENRSESNRISPKIRLQDEEVRKQHFVKENDWEYWEQIEGRIYNDETIKNHSRAIINRMVNIYEEWYNTLNVGELCDF